MTKVRSLYLCVAALSLPLAGCATAPLGRAVELSTAGTEASTKLVGAAQTVETVFETSVTDDGFLRAIQAAGVPPGTQCSLISSGPMEAASGGTPFARQADIDKTATALRARTQLATALGKAYSGMNALAAYDARGAVEGGINDAFAATNTLRTAVGLSPISDTVGAIASAAGGALVQGRQLARVRRASAKLRTALIGYKAGLEAGKEATVSVLQDGIESRYALREALWRRGHLDARGLVSKVGEGSGLAAIEADESPFTAKDDAMCRAVRTALDGERQSASSAAEAEFQKQIEVVDELISAHEKFEKGAPVDAAHLATLLDQLTALATKIGGKTDAS